MMTSSAPQRICRRLAATELEKPPNRSAPETDTQVNEKISDVSPEYAEKISDVSPEYPKISDVSPEYPEMGRRSTQMNVKDAPWRADTTDDRG